MIYWFQAHNIMIHYLYTLQNDLHSKSSYSPSLYEVTLLFLVMTTFWIYSLGNSEVRTAVLLTVTVLCVTSA